MERTLSVNYPVLRQNKAKNTTVVIYSIVHQYGKQEGIDRKNVQKVI